MGLVKCCTITMALLCLLMVVDLSLTQSCGKRKVVNPLIVNGTATKDGHWPWYAAIFHNKRLSSDYACGGTILDRSTVLTAAHCVMTPNGVIARRRLRVQVGRHRISLASKRVQELEASELVVHPEYSVNSIKHDIALVKLATDITYTDYVQPVCLWNRRDDMHLLVGTWGTVVGFGIDETDTVSDTLREATIPVVSHFTCIESNQGAFEHQLTSNMFCAGNRDGVSACNGDSGGGLYFNYNDTWFIRGIVSFTKPRERGNKCDTKEYTVFTDVAKYLGWIKQHMTGTGDKSIVTRIETNSLKIRLLPMSSCGPNPYANREELSKPVMLGYPWMGLIECSNDGSDEVNTICHAILISNFYLITSSVCILMRRQCSRPYVLLGEYNLDTTTDCAQVDGEKVCSSPVQKIPIESVIMHPEYNLFTYENNIALIRLAARADTSGNNVKPICLPVTNELRTLKASHYTISLWTFNFETGVLGPVLERSIRKILPLTECQELYRFEFNITTRQMCTRNTAIAKKVCQLELAAAPLQLVQQVEGRSRYVLHGIYSVGQNCDGDFPDVYTNVASYVDWILENM